jgi:tetratricopeptide (TPR) repeat protein
MYAVLCTPLLIAQTYIFPLVTVKTFVFQALIEVLVALWAILVLSGMLPRPRFSPLVALGGAFLLILVLSAVLGVDPVRSFWSTQERAIGVVFLAHLGAYVLMLWGAREQVGWERYLGVSVGVAAVTSIYAFVQPYVPQLFYEPSVGRPGSFLGNPSFLAGYLLFHLYFAAWLAVRAFRSGRYEWGTFAGFTIPIFLGAIFLTQTRGAILGLAASFVALAVWAAFAGGGIRLWRRFTLRYAGASVLIGLALLTSVFLLTRTAPVWQLVPGVSRLTSLTLQSSDIQPRLIALRISWEAFLARPVLGFGYENFKYAFDERYDPKLLRYGFAETYFDKPHNVFLEFLVTTGAAGFLAHIALLIALAVALARSRYADFFPFGIAALTAYVVQNIFLFDSFGPLIAFALLVGFAAPAGAAHGAHAAVRSRRPVLFTLGSLATLLAGFGVFANISILVANNGQYWVLNYLLFRKTELAYASYERAVNAPVNPYRDAARKDFSSAVSQVYLQDVPVTPEMTTRAVDDLRSAIRNNPRNYFLRVSFADLVTVLRPNDATALTEAEEELAEALRLSPRRQQSYYALAKIRILQNRWDDALRVAEEAIDIEPEIGESHFYHGLIAFEAGKTELGFRSIETAERLRRVPKTGHEMRIIANHYADAGSYDKAIALYRQAIDESAADLEARLKLGIVYFYAGDVPAARAELEIVARSTDVRQAPSYELLKPIFDAVGVPIP